MSTQKPQLYFLLVLLAGTVILAFFIFRPFLYTLALAAVFAVVLQPVHHTITRSIRRPGGLAALITLLVVVAFIVTPLTLLGMQIFDEAWQLYISLTENGGGDAVLHIINVALSDLHTYIPATRDLSTNVNQYLKQGLSWLLQYLGTLFVGFAKMMLHFFVFLVALYYLLKDGEKLKAAVIAMSPLTDHDDEAIFIQLERAVTSVMKGTLLVALLQGVLTAIGFAAFGVPNPVLWGSAAAIAALIPGIGTALVLTPAIVFLFVTGNLFAALGLLVWGVGAVGLIDNFLGPKLVGRGMQLHPLIILLSVLGGIGFFGPIGFLLGPLTISLLFALLNIYFSLMKEER